MEQITINVERYYDKEYPAVIVYALFGGYMADDSTVNNVSDKMAVFKLIASGTNYIMPLSQFLEQFEKIEAGSGGEK